MQLHNVRASVRGLNGPIEISSAQLLLLPNEARVEKLSARAIDALWTGSVVLPRGCGVPGACMARFDLNTEEIGMDEISEWVGSRPSERSWYQRLTSAEPAASSFLKDLRATGGVNIHRLRIRNLVAGNVSAVLNLDRGKVKVSELQADVLGGKQRGDWQLDFAAPTPTYTGSGALTGISLQQVADAMHDEWISGTAGGTYQITASGADATAFWQSAEGVLQFDVRSAVLSHISLGSDEGPVRVARWQGRAQLRGGKIEIDQGKLNSPAGVYEIGGTASLGRVLNLKLTQPGDSKAGAGVLVYGITGTVAEPRVAVTPSPQTQARLKQ